ncbi:hypothetical protein [Spirosoma profusum]|nr:hypothetical protein [Spirosoma profusum]
MMHVAENNSFPPHYVCPHTYKKCPFLDNTYHQALIKKGQP